MSWSHRLSTLQKPLTLDRNVFEFQPRLQGKLVRLRPLAAEDFNSLFHASSDPKIWEQLPRANRHQPEVFKAFFDESLKLRTTLVIISSESGNIIGSSRYARYDPKKDEVEIGWTFLERQYWRRGYNQEAKRLMIQHAFRFVNSVFLVAAKSNFRSCRAIEKIGATKECELAWPPNAKEQEPSILFRIRKQSSLQAQS